MTLIIFIHAAIIGRYKERLEQYLNLINESGLYNEVTNIYITYVGNDHSMFDVTLFDRDNKIILHQISTQLEDYELPTHSYIYDYCKKHPNYNILYIHTKGITGTINDCIEDWVSYMIYFLIGKWNICIETLKNFSTVGVDLRDYPTLHYSGNFWWATSNHIVSLPEPRDFANIQKYPNPLHSPRHNQEFWICYDKQLSIHGCLWESNINCYERHLHRYPNSNYLV